MNQFSSAVTPFPIDKHQNGSKAILYKYLHNVSNPKYSFPEIFFYIFRSRVFENRNAGNCNLFRYYVVLKNKKCNKSTNTRITKHSKKYFICVTLDLRLKD